MRKLMRKAGLPALVAVAILLGASADAGAQVPEEPTWTRDFYFAAEGGWATVKIPGRSMTIQGIDFTNVQASADDAGLTLALGYHITDNVGFEWSASWLGNVHATFDYFQPPGEHGTGETTVKMYNSGLALVLGHRVRNFLVFAKGGVQFWNAEYDTRFYLPDGEIQERSLHRSGNHLFYGAGALWNFAPNWTLRAEALRLRMDLADVTSIAVGLEARLW